MSVRAHLQLDALDPSSVVDVVGVGVIPVAVFVFPHDDVELAARLVSEHEADVTVALVFVDEPRSAILHRTEVVVTCTHENQLD